MSRSIYRTEKSQLKYQLHYDKLCQRGKERAKTRQEANKILGYCESHHIIPLCLGGTNDKENLVFLSAAEHFIAHQFLVMIYPNFEKLIYALSLMCTDAHGNRMNNKMFDWIRKKNSETRKGKTKDNCEFMARSAKNRTGHRKNTHYYLQQRSKDYRILTDQHLDEIVYMRDILKFEFKQIHEKFLSQNIETAYTTIVGNYNKRKLQFDENFSSSQFGSRVLTKEQCQFVVDMVDIKGLSIKEVFEILVNEGIKIALPTIYGTYHLTKRQNDPLYVNVSLNTKSIKFSNEDLENLKLMQQNGSSYTKCWKWITSLGYKVSYNTIYSMLRIDK